MGERNYRWLLVSLAFIGLTADQASKYGVFRSLYNDGVGGTIDVVPGWFRLIAQFDPSAGHCGCGFSCLQTWSGETMPHVNRGALFGLGNSEGGLANWFFAGISFVAAIAIVAWGTRKGPAKEKWLSAALGLILGGTVGNLYDRLVFHGVRDFLYFYKIEWPVFNVADCCLVVGAGLLLLQAVFAPPPTEEAPTSDDEPVIPAPSKA